MHKEGKEAKLIFLREKKKGKTVLKHVYNEEIAY